MEKIGKTLNKKTLLWGLLNLLPVLIIVIALVALYRDFQILIWSNVYTYNHLLLIFSLIIFSALGSAYYFKQFEKTEKWQEIFLQICVSAITSFSLTIIIFEALYLFRVPFRVEFDGVFNKMIFYVLSVVFSVLFVVLLNFLKIKPQSKSKKFDFVNTAFNYILPGFIFLLLPVFIPQMGLWVGITILILIYSFLISDLNTKLIRYAK